MSPGDTTDLSMSPSGSGAFSMSPPTTCLPLLEVGHDWTPIDTGHRCWVTATREAARPEGWVLAPAVRDTGFTVGNTRRPCRIERPAAAIIGALKQKNWLAYARNGWAVGQPSQPLEKEGTWQIGRETRHMVR